MLSLTPDLLTRLRAALSRCSQFDSNEALQALFDNDDRINPWANEVQNANRSASRVDFVIALLRDRENSTYHENALVLLLYALRDTIDSRDTLHAELATLARELSATLLPTSRSSTHIPQLTTPNPQPTNPDRDSLNRQLSRARRTLHILEEQAAGFGALHIPAHLQIELEEQRDRVAALEARLR